ncbi:MAG: UDP-3-O-(3-hydroxymyristoyl)glucosamine N-acyltransferase [Phycisphaerales bacterium]|nr:UDP-3-O-(3-hydroxymyristoyl)glucosamine N-acyltransferase [Phycisphaerales bacterium]
MDFTAEQLAQCIGGTLDGPGSTLITGCNDMRSASGSDVTFIGNERYARKWGACQAMVAVVTQGIEVPGHDPVTRTLIRVDNADLAIITLLTQFVQPEELPEVGVHSSAVVEASATVGIDARIGALVFIGKGASIGARVVLHPGARIYPGVTIGEGTVIHANAVVRERCVIGRNVIIHAGAVIGTDGFGYRPAPDGKSLVHIPHLGHVVLEDSVEIGSCTCVDRGTFGATRICAGTKLDNLCQVGHNVRIGSNTVMAALSGVAGSSTIGSWCRIGAASGIADHRTVGDGAQLAARTGLINDVPPGETWGGMPAREIRTEMRHMLALQKLSPLARDLARLVEAAKAGAP